MSERQIQLDEETESTHILSGMLLNHCLTYGALFDELNQNSSNNSVKPNDCVIISFRLTNNIDNNDSKSNVNQTLVSYGGVSKYLRGSNGQVTSTTCPIVKINPVDITLGVLWLHLLNTVILSEVMLVYDIPIIVLEYFIDSSPYGRCHELSNGAYLIQLVSINVQNDIVNVKKLHVYLTNDLIITYEHRSHAVIDESNESDNYLITLNPVGLTRGTSINIGSELNLTLGPGIETTTLGQSFSIDPNNRQYSGILLDFMISRINDKNSQIKILTQGCRYLLYEAAKFMITLANPVLKIHAKEMKRLHDAVFLRKEKPDFNDGLFFMEQIDVFRSSYDMIDNVLSQSKLVIPYLNGLLDVHQSQELTFNIDRTLNQTNRLKVELNRIEKNMKDLITRRNDRINLTLTIVATTFLPLTFLTGLFGMNFTDDGFLVYIYHARNGSAAFFVIAMISLIVLFYWFNSEGFFNILTTKEINKHVGILKKQGDAYNSSSSNQPDTNANISDSNGYRVRETSLEKRRKSLLKRRSADKYSSGIRNPLLSV